MNMLTLSEDCQRLIFARVSLHDLLRLRAVCRQWNVLVHEIGLAQRELHLYEFRCPLQNCLRRHLFEEIERVADFQTDGQFDLTEYNTLLLHHNNNAKGDREYSNDGGRFIARIFPYVQSCTIFFHLSTVADIETPKRSFDLAILCDWSESLVMLKTDMRCLQEHIEPQLFWEYLRSMISLRRLHLFHYDEDHFGSPPAAITAQLTELTIFQGSSRQNFARILEHIGPSLVKLRIRGLPMQPEILAKLANSVTHMCCLSKSEWGRSLHSLASMRALTHLDLSHAQQTASVNNFSDLMSFLHPLSRLYSLVFDIDHLLNASHAYGARANLQPLSTLRVFTLTDRSELLNDVNFANRIQLGFYQLMRGFPNLHQFRVFSMSSHDKTFQARITGQLRRFFTERTELKFVRRKSKLEKIVAASPSVPRMLGMSLK